MRYATLALIVLFAGASVWVCCGGVFSSLALYSAVRAGDESRVKELAQLGVNLDTQYFFSGESPLLIALEMEDREVYHVLLEEGANPNRILRRGRTVMHESAGMPDAWWLQEAIDHGGNVDLVNEGSSLFRDRTPINSAINGQSAACLELLINAKADLNRENGSGQSPLMMAICMSRYDFALTLLEAGADYERQGVLERSFVDEVRIRHDGMALSDEQKVHRAKVKKWLADRKAL